MSRFDVDGVLAQSYNVVSLTASTNADYQAVVSGINDGSLTNNEAGSLL